MKQPKISLPIAQPLQTGERLDRIRPILMNDFRAEPEELTKEETAACERVIHSGRYILGQEVENFERDWAQACGCRCAVGMGNGMDAIETGLRTLGIGSGDEVITTAMTAFASVLAILRAGATPVLADIRKTDALMDVTSVQRCLSSRTKAVLLVHLYGRVSDMEAWTKFCGEKELSMIEDSAQAHLASWSGRKAGTFGAWGAFSFYPTKNLGAVGDGGALVTDSADIAVKARTLRNYGQIGFDHHVDLGLNSRLDELQAALLSVRLKWLSQFTERRREIAAQYFAEIQNPRVELLSPPESVENHVYHLFVLRCEDRDDLARHLKDMGVQTLIHYPVAIHRQAAAGKMRIDPAGLPNAETHAAQCLSIPCHPQMHHAAVQEVIDAVNSFA